MIERLPLELFDDTDDSVPSGAAADDVMIDADQQAGGLAEIDDSTDIVLVDCQWCDAPFDSELLACPDCGASTIRPEPIPEGPKMVVCQWCLTEFDVGPTNCPSCSARVVIPGQYVPGEDDPYPSLTSRAIMARQAQSRQMLAGMIASGGIESFVAGLISLAISIIDDD